MAHTHLVIGAGQIGTAIARVLADAHPVETIDIEPVSRADLTHDDIHTLHICFPWTDSFTRYVLDYQSMFEPQIVVIHSTVPVGICDLYGWTFAGIRGRHPNLEEGIRTFTMQVGGPAAQQVAMDFEECGVHAITYPRAAELEAGKLWELYDLGADVRDMHEIHDWCAARDLDFDIVYTETRHIYNAGYQELDPKFAKRVLDYQPGPLGGHCVAQNTPLLDSDYVRDIIEPISPDTVDWDAHTARKRTA